MNENIDWLEVVLDYGKRNPDVTYGNLLNIEYAKDLLVSDLITYDHFGQKFLTDSKIYGHVFGLNYFWSDGKLEYFIGHKDKNISIKWKFVPEHILLRLLTEGKEDLI